MMLSIALWALGASLGVLAVTAVASRVVGRYSVVDIAWGLAFVAIAVTAGLAGSGTPWRRGLLVVLVGVWGLRLAWHIGSRQRGHGEDPRYTELMRGQGFGTAVWKVFGLQAVLAWVVSAPVIGGATTSVLWPWLVWVGVVLWAVGLGFEAIGDAQWRHSSGTHSAGESWIVACGGGRVTPTTSGMPVCGGGCGWSAGCHRGRW